jgi:hypothetical protein
VAHVVSVFRGRVSAGFPALIVREGLWWPGLRRRPVGVVAAEDRAAPLGCWRWRWRRERCGWCVRAAVGGRQTRRGRDDGSVYGDRLAQWLVGGGGDS